MSLTNPNKPVTEARLQEFYHRIKNFLGFTEMPSEDISEVISPLPSVKSRYQKYSTEEQIVGEWIDGKPLYQKTINFGALPNNTTKSVANGITNLNLIVGCEAWAKNTAGSMLGLPHTYYSGSSIMAISLDFDANSIIVVSKANVSGYTECYVTIRYTKTTD